MEPIQINVADIEALQSINDIEALQSLLEKARRHIVNGSSVQLLRKQPGGEMMVFDEMDTEDAFQKYKDWVLKYM